MTNVEPRLPRLMKLGPPLVLVGHRCADCDRVAFPPDPYGCEGCGAEHDRLQPIELEAAGIIHSLAEVHRHHHDKPETPFTVAAITLDDGPALKAVLVGATETAAVGDRVVGVTEPSSVGDSKTGGVELVDLRFTLALEPAEPAR